jgi:poly(3-hydroxybutyrate) depolymerase
MNRLLAILIVLASLLRCAVAADDSPIPAPPLPAGISAEDQRSITKDLQHLREELSGIRSTKADLRADAEIFEKGITWALRYETNLAPNDVALLKKSLIRGIERADFLAAGKHPWTTNKGKVLRGFVSAVDGSTQCYGLVVPHSYDCAKPIRLDVVLHGSSKPVGLSELRFGARFDEGDTDTKPPPEAGYIELHPLGRVENCYRWAGETDVFEAIEAVCRNYRIDRDRIVLRGMSMGASGTWHLGLKYPDRWVAIGPYCGYVDTHRFSETPLPNFIRVGPLPPVQERMLHMLDSVDYAANGAVVPEIAAIGDKDVFFQAHVIMGEAMKREGLQMVNLISPGTGHVIDPVTHAEQMRRINEYAVKGIDHAPRQVRFVTWTLKYPRCHWIELLSLFHHYERAEISATVNSDGDVDMPEPINIQRFAIHPPLLQGAAAKLRIARQDVVLPHDRPTGALTFVRNIPGDWNYAGPLEESGLTGKRPGLQGPIDDAFTAPFLCVRGTGQPWNAAVGAWADATLRRFSYEWARYMRGDLPVKDDTDVTDEDIRTKNLILFGDPGSNRWIREALPKLPCRWERDHLAVGEHHYAAQDHAPAFICPNPLPGAGGHYLVLNSGHTFHEKEFAAFNYLLFPRLGDWAVLQVLRGAEFWQIGSPEFPEKVEATSFFDETWRKPTIASP